MTDLDVVDLVPRVPTVRPAEGPEARRRIIRVAPSRNGSYASANTKWDGDPFFEEHYHMQTHDKLAPAMATHVARYPRVPLSIVEMFPDGRRLVFSHRGSEMHYSASMVKIAACYAIFALRTRLRLFARTQPEPSHNVLQRAEHHFNPLIVAAAGALKPLANCKPASLLPKYGVAFEPSPMGVSFKDEFHDHLLLIHDNRPAGHVIHGVGYGYLNAQLERASLANCGLNLGLWLAGDYWEKETINAKGERRKTKGKYPAYRVKCVNDRGRTAQGTTIEAAAQLFAMMMDGRAVSKNASWGMRNSLRAKNRSWLSNISGRWCSLFTTTDAKPGRGTVPGNVVRSDVSHVVHTRQHTPRFVVAFQNVQKPKGEIKAYGIEFAESLARAFSQYLKT